VLSFDGGPSIRPGLPSRGDLLDCPYFFELWGVPAVGRDFMQQNAAPPFLRERELCLWLSYGRDTP